MIKRGLILAATLLIAGCNSGSTQIEGFWRYGKSDGWFPLEKVNGNPIYIEGRKAFINETTMIVNCEGDPLKVGQYFLYLDRSLITHFFKPNANGSGGAIVERVKPNYLMEDRKGKLWNGDTIMVSFDLRGSGEETKSQCGDDSILPRRAGIATQNDT